MLILSGPTYRYNGERLDRPETIVIQDHHYDPDAGYALMTLLENSTCDIRHHLLVFDHVLRQDEFGHYAHVCLPLLLAAEAQEFNHEGILPCWQSRSHAFNFMINKPRPNRLILLDLVHDLQLTNYRHSLCWQQDYKNIPVTDFRFGDERVMDQGFRNGSHSNASTYHHLLKSRVFELTAVSLITEPAFHERETIMTEKTIMAIWAGTLPIWVGGWRCADTMRDYGFDVFDDVIDHSYQHLSDPEDRCFHAIKQNQAILRSVFDLAPFHDRLKHNLDLMRSNVWLRQIRQITKDHPHLQSYVDQFRNGLLSEDSTTTF